MDTSNFIFDWVLNNELAVGNAPIKEVHFRKLKEKGIIGIISLCHKDEIPSQDPMIDKFITKRIVLPDHKQKRLVSVEEIEKAIDLIETIKKNGPVFVHCVASVERSPLVCMAWLIRKHRLTIQQALDYMMEIHLGTNPLPSQLKILNLLV